MDEQKFIDCIMDTLELQREDIGIGQVDESEGCVEIAASVKIRHNCYITISYLEHHGSFEWEVEGVGSSNESLLNAAIDYTMRVDEVVHHLQRKIDQTNTKAKATRSILASSLEIL